MTQPDLPTLSLIACIVRDGTMKGYTRYRHASTLLEFSPVENDLFDKLSAYVGKYHKVPAKDTYENLVNRPLPEPNETAEYYWDRLYSRHVHRSIVSRSELAAEHLHDKNPIAALEVLRKMINTLDWHRTVGEAADFRDAADVVMTALAKKVAGDDAAVRFGWPTLDDMSSGMTAGDLVSMAGRPGSGKTYMLLHTALHVWKTQKRPVLFASLEMSREQIFMRLAAMVASIPFEWIRTGGVPTYPIDEREKLRQTLESLKENDALTIADAGAAGSVTDLVALCQQIKPAVVFVDAAYLLATEGRFSKYEKVGEACRELKRLAVRENVPVMASWQLNRESKKANVIGLEHLAGSDEISQLSSVVMGLFEEDSIANARSRRVTILKGRHGEQGSFRTNWCFNTMNFEELKEELAFELY